MHDCHIGQSHTLCFSDLSHVALIRGHNIVLIGLKQYCVHRIVEDPDDNKFLGCALEAKAYYVVSGDNHLLSLKHFHGIQIIDATTSAREMRSTTAR